MSQNNFQIILYVVFGFLVLVGFGSLALYGFLQKDKANTSSHSSAKIVIWGTVDSREIQPVVDQLNRQGGERSYASVSYTEKHPNTVEREYLESVAFGSHPDLLLLDHNTVLTLRDTFQPIPFSYFPLAQYRQTFIQPADLFVIDTGYLAVPFLSDSLVLYYNENLRLRNRIQSPLGQWSELTGGGYPDLLRGSLERADAVIPLGSYGNYGNAADVFLSLLLQAREGRRSLDADTVRDTLSFYAGFADPRSSVYAWNTSLSDARDLFISDRLVYYPGYISEYADLRRANPNIVVRVAPLPQLSRDAAPVTLTTLYGFAVPRSGTSPVAAAEVAFDFLGVFYDTGNDVSALFSLPPAIRAYRPPDSVDVAGRVFADSLFSGRGLYLSPQRRSALSDVLREVIVGVRSVEDAVDDVLEAVQ